MRSDSINPVPVCSRDLMEEGGLPPGSAAGDSQRSGHLLEIIRTAGIKDGAALEQLQGLLDLALQAQD